MSINISTFLGKINVVYLPVAYKGIDEISEKLGQEFVYIPVSYDSNTIKKYITMLAEKIDVDISKFDFKEEDSFKELEKAKKIIGDTAIAIDYTFTTAPFSLAKLLLDYGFNVKKIYVDSISEKEVFKEVQDKYGDRDILIYPTVNVAMRTNDREQKEKYLALGQKATYFTDTKNFVNEVECGGHYGFDGIKILAKNMIDAFENEKDASNLIQKKGLGCSCLL